jgi:hypothetical protein
MMLTGPWRRSSFMTEETVILELSGFELMDVHASCLHRRKSHDQQPYILSALSTEQCSVHCPGESCGWGQSAICMISNARVLGRLSWRHSSSADFPPVKACVVLWFYNRGTFRLVVCVATRVLLQCYPDDDDGMSSGCSSLNQGIKTTSMLMSLGNDNTSDEEVFPSPSFSSSHCFFFSPFEYLRQGTMRLP